MTFTHVEASALSLLHPPADDAPRTPMPAPLALSLALSTPAPALTLSAGSDPAALVDALQGQAARAEALRTANAMLLGKLQVLQGSIQVRERQTDRQTERESGAPAVTFLLHSFQQRVQPFLKEFASSPTRL